MPSLTKPVATRIFPAKVAEALMAQAAELFASPPQIMKIDVLAAKLPG